MILDLNSGAFRLVPADQRAVLEARAAAMLEDAVRLQGRRALESTRRCAALHEAGHVVVNTITANGRFPPPVMTRIWRAPLAGFTVWLGETVPASDAPDIPVDARVDLDAYLTLAVQQLGGVVSELLFDSRDYRAGSSVDEWIVASGCAQTLAALGIFSTGEEALVMMLAAAKAMLEANTGAVRAIAAALETQRRVEGAELAHLVKTIRRSPSA